MQSIALFVRLLIAVIFCVAAGVKLFSQQRTRAALREFGLPDSTLKLLGLLLPLAELGTAIMLIPTATVVPGILGSIALLLAFITAISINLAIGRRPECNCFGQLHSRPISWRTLARNGLILGGAAFVLWCAHYDAPLSIASWASGYVDRMPIIFLWAVVFGAISVEAWFILHLVRQNGRLLLRMDLLEKSAGVSGMAATAGLPIGSAAPTFELTSLSDDTLVTLKTLKTKRNPIVLVFSDPACGPCSALLPKIAQWEREHSAPTIVLISRGTKEANRLKIGDNHLEYVLLQKDREVAVAYQVNGTPGAVLLDQNGMIASPVSMGSESVMNLVMTAMQNHLMSNGSQKTRVSTNPDIVINELSVGDAAPHFRLPDLSGRMIDSSSFKGRDSLVIFWNPNCGFCTKMLPDLRLWEERHAAEVPALLLISSGSVAENRALAMQATILLDQQFTTGAAFRVRGTPSAVLVDASGKIASGVAVGAPAIFTLANLNRRTTVMAGMSTNGS